MFKYLISFLELGDKKMFQGNYQQIVQMISRTSGLSKEDIERKIEAKKARLSGLISKEGAAQIVASELGINFENEKMKISELLDGMRKINIIGRIIKINRVIEYNKNNKSGKIGSFLLADDTSNIRVVLWDVNHITLIENGEIKEGDFIEISRADIRNSEAHLSGFSDIKKSQIIIENIKEKPVLHHKSLYEIKLNDNVAVRAFVVQIYGPTFFYVCPECNKKVVELNKCLQHGNVIAKKRAILTLILDDGTDSLRAILFGDQISKIATNEELENSETFMPRRENLLGKEFIIEASSRKNKLSDTLELHVNDIHEVDIDKLIEELEHPITTY